MRLDHDRVDRPDETVIDPPQLFSSIILARCIIKTLALVAVWHPGGGLRVRKVYSEEYDLAYLSYGRELSDLAHI